MNEFINNELIEHNCTFYSDENDIVDSEPELEIPHKPSVEAYKDHSMSPTKIQSPAKHRTPIKRIDLGAAANYGKTQTVINSPVATNNPLETEISSVDLLNIVDNSNKQSNDFGDFNAAFSATSTVGTTVKNNRYFCICYINIFVL